MLATVSADQIWTARCAASRSRKWGAGSTLSVGIVAKDVDDGKRKDHGFFIEGAMVGSGGVFWNILEKDWRSSPSGRMPAHSVPPRCPVL